MDIHEAISALTRRIDLTREQAVIVQRILMTGQATPSQIAAFLTALHMKGETVEEITGFAMTMRELATPILATRRPLVDTCGTGGDHAGTFNISTAAAFVVAGAGIAVAKHGNRSATSKCGSADVLEALGININATPEVVARCIDETGIGFLFARALHGAMKHVGPIRAELKFRTIFNILGPLTNPAGADGQVMGVFSTALVEPITQVLQHLGARHAFVVAGCDGLDELTITGPSQVGETRDGEVRLYEITPEQVGLARADIAALRGGDAEENAAILRAVLDGETGPRRDIVLLNAAPAIVAGGAAETLKAGVAVAAQSIDSGAARAKLETLIEASHAAG